MSSWHRPPTPLHLRMQAGERIEAWRPLRLRGEGDQVRFDCGSCPRPESKPGCLAHECEQTAQARVESVELEDQAWHLLSIMGLA